MSRRTRALGVAVGGVLLGHWLTYIAVAPHPATRAALLRSSGHGYVGVADQVGLVLTLTALAALFVARLTRAHGPPTTRSIIGRLVAFQVSAFLLMEVLERLAVGMPLISILTHGLLPIGVAMQVAAASAGALVVRLILRIADRVAEALARPEPNLASRPLSVSLPLAPARPRHHALATAGVRAPPVA